MIFCCCLLDMEMYVCNISADQPNLRLLVKVFCTTDRSIPTSGKNSKVQLLLVGLFL